MRLTQLFSPRPVLVPSATPPPPLRLLFWETTVACNLECVHCRRLEVSRERSKQDLTTADAAAFIRTLPETPAWFDKLTMRAAKLGRLQKTSS